MLWMCDLLNNPVSWTIFLGNLGVFTSCWLQVTIVIYFTPLKDMQLYIYGVVLLPIVKNHREWVHREHQQEQWWNGLWQLCMWGWRYIIFMVARDQEFEGRYDNTWKRSYSNKNLRNGWWCVQSHCIQLDHVWEVFFSINNFYQIFYQWMKFHWLILNMCFALSPDVIVLR